MGTLVSLGFPWALCDLFFSFQNPKKVEHAGLKSRAPRKHAYLKVGVPRAFPSITSQLKRSVHWGIAGSLRLPRDNL